ncbi:MAG: phosphate ABC transporter substrate-binding protein [Thermaerobacter sp.]|nr:phosphate ABC transporter substrate-binding protein [Thermaerobacter sp.]
MKKIVMLVLVTALALVAIGCQPQKTTLDVTGSDTMVNLGAALAEEFMKTNRNIEVAVSGGGSGAGVAALIEGRTNIAQSSRDLRPEERTRAAARGTLHEIIVGWDGLAVAVHPSNPVNELTLAQLGQIYRGEVRNWKELGGNDAPIVILSRDTTSGTFVFFREFVVQERGQKRDAEYHPDTMMMPSTEALYQEIARNPNAIGYVGLGFLRPTIKTVGIKADDASAAVLPSVESVLAKTYPLARPLYFFVVGELTGALKTYVDFVLSDKGQQVVRSLEFVPIR